MTGPEDHEGITLVVLLEVPPADVDAITAYEDAVLPLLQANGGQVQRRLRAVDASAEVHLIRFDSSAAMDAFLTDPGRLRAQRLLGGTVIHQRVVQVHEVEVPAPVDGR